MPRFSANLGFLFTELPFLERFQAAARAGFTAVEFPDPYSHDLDRIRQELASNGLTCVLINFPMGNAAQGDKGLASLPERQPEFRESLELGIDRARQLGCPRLNCMAGRAPEGADERVLGGMRAMLVENLRLAAGLSARAGLAVNLEPLSTLEVPGYLVTGSDQAMAIINDVGAANLQLQFDCYHLQLMEGDVLARLQRLAPHIGHIQIADVPGRHEPGSGRMDYPALFAAIDACGYRGWVGAEYRPSRRTEETLGWRPTSTTGTPVP